MSPSISVRELGRANVVGMGGVGASGHSDKKVSRDSKQSTRLPTPGGLNGDAPCSVFAVVGRSPPSWKARLASCRAHEGQQHTQRKRSRHISAPQLDLQFSEHLGSQTRLEVRPLYEN